MIEFLTNNWHIILLDCAIALLIMKNRVLAHP